MEEDQVKTAKRLLLIGGSAGSLEVLLQLLPALKSPLLFAIVIVVHRKGGESMLVHLLSQKTNLLIKEAEEKEPLQNGTVYIAPADYHLLIEADKTLSLDASEKLHYSRPSIDVTFESAADVFGPSTAAMLLSGANADGAAGLQAIKQAGGIAVAQQPQEASVAYMPQFAIDHYQITQVLSTPQMINFINSWQ